MASLEQQFARDVGPLERALRDATLSRDALKAVGKKLSKSARKDLEKAIGRDRRMRNFPVKDQAFTGKVRFTTKLTEGATMKFSPASLWGIIEGGSQRSGNHPGIAPLAPNVIDNTADKILPAFETQVAIEVERRLGRG